MKQGERNIRIISANMGNFRNYENMRDVNIRMNNKKKWILYVYKKHIITKITK